jgi:hypothetical protein
MIGIVDRICDFGMVGVGAILAFRSFLPEGANGSDIHGIERIRV